LRINDLDSHETIWAMGATVRVVGGLALLSLALGCGNPLEPSLVVGDWSGRNVPSHFAYIQIRFERQGTGLVGTACSFDGPYLSWTGVPVTINDREISFRVTHSSGSTSVFRGEFNEEGTAINGSWDSSTGSKVTLQRGGNLCANAIPFPTLRGLA